MEIYHNISVLLLTLAVVVDITGSLDNEIVNMHSSKYAHLYQITAEKVHQSCRNVCMDLPPDDTEPVCMMYSRYKKGFQYFVNHCHARRTICKDSLILHMVHPSRCKKSNQFFLPIT